MPTAMGTRRDPSSDLQRDRLGLADQPPRMNTIYINQPAILLSHINEPKHTNQPTVDGWPGRVRLPSAPRPWPLLRQADLELERTGAGRGWRPAVTHLSCPASCPEACAVRGGACSASAGSQPHSVCLSRVCRSEIVACTRAAMRVGSAPAGPAQLVHPLHAHPLSWNSRQLETPRDKERLRVIPFEQDSLLDSSVGMAEWQPAISICQRSHR